MEQLDDDIYGRNVFFSTDGTTTDTYQVVDPNDSNYTFNLTFPFETAQWQAYSLINEIPLVGIPNLVPFDPDNTKSWASGRTADRINIQATLGTMYFDLDLGKPIWYIGSGITGWIDATGAQV